MYVQERNIDVGSGRSVATEFKVFGETSPDVPYGAVFANGWGCLPETTELPAEALAEAGFQVITFEPDPTAKLTTENRARIMRTLGEEILGTYIAMGFSLGGDVASRVAYTDYEDKAFNVAGLVDVAGNHESSDRVFTTLVGNMTEEEFVHGIGLGRYIFDLSASRTSSVRNYAAQIAKMRLNELAAYHFAAVDTMHEARAGGSLHTLLGYGGPTFYIHGDGERAEYLPEIREQTQITEIEVPGAGHFLHADAPQAYIAALTRCLTEINN